MLLYARLTCALAGVLLAGLSEANGCGCCGCCCGPQRAAVRVIGPTPAYCQAVAPAPGTPVAASKEVAADDKAKDEAEIQKNLAKLSDEDRKLAEAQKYCAIEDDNRLGAHGVPVKIVLKDSKGKDQPVFLCCKGCKDDAMKDPAATLAKVEKLKAKAKDEDKK